MMPDSQIPNEQIQNRQSQSTLQQEWTTLHNSTEKSENLSLLIKLVSVVICLLGVIVNLSPVILTLLLLILWLQEAIWKTFQGRAEQRLLTIEEAYLDKDPSGAFQFYSECLASRTGIKKLVSEYLCNAIRPTIAFPYLVLLPLSFIAHYL